MVAVAVKVVNHTKRVIAAVDRAQPEVLADMASIVVENVQDLFIRSPDPSRPGSSPHTREGALPASVDQAVGTDDVIIGPVASEVGQVGAAHEFGIQYKGQDYDKREFMGPGLDLSTDRIAQEWYRAI